MPQKLPFKNFPPSELLLASINFHHIFNPKLLSLQRFLPMERIEFKDCFSQTSIFLAWAQKSFLFSLSNSMAWWSQFQFGNFAGHCWSLENQATFETTCFDSVESVNGQVHQQWGIGTLLNMILGSYWPAEPNLSSCLTMFVHSNSKLTFSGGACMRRRTDEFG